jgi:hypothetical protein
VPLGEEPVDMDEAQLQAVRTTEMVLRLIGNPGGPHLLEDGRNGGLPVEKDQEGRMSPALRSRAVGRYPQSRRRSRRAVEAEEGRLANLAGLPILVHEL